MFSTMRICSLIVIFASLVLMGYAFYTILKRKQTKETDIGVIQRQLRGFALLVIANFIAILGLTLCTTNFISGVMKMFV